jgi:hypothetical protein
MAFETLDAASLAYVNAAQALADSGDRGGSYEMANALGRGSRAPTGITIGHDDVQALWDDIGGRLEAYRLAFYKAEDVGELQGIASVEALAATDVMAAWRAAAQLRLTYPNDRVRLSERFQAAAVASGQ